MKYKAPFLLKALFLTTLSLAFAFPSYAANQTIATISGQPVTEKDIDDYTKRSMQKIDQEIYQIKRQGLERYIDVTLLEKEAKSQNISVAKLLQKEVNSKTPTVSDQEIEDFYNKNKYRFRKKGTKTVEFQELSEVKPLLKQQLLSLKRRDRRDEYLDSLRQKYKVAISLEPPRWPVKVAKNDPTMGQTGAPIHLIEFSSYQCGYCKKARPTITKLLEKYKGKIHYTFRDYPLSFQPQAKPSAHAAQCAGEQGKYWEYSNMIWDNQAKLRSDKDVFKNFATDLKLDVSKFEACMKSGKFYKDIDQDQAEGSEVGVSGTPAFFVNGIFLSGAQPYEKFSQIIEDELKRKK